MQSRPRKHQKYTTKMIESVIRDVNLYQYLKNGPCANPGWSGRLVLDRRPSPTSTVFHSGTQSTTPGIALNITRFADAASHVGISPQWTATKISMPARECLCRIRRGLWPLWLSAATPLGGDITSQLQLGCQANFYHAECSRQPLNRELSRALRVAKG